MAILRGLRGPWTGRSCELRSRVTLVGRNAARCDIVLDHFAVSREHARIEVVENAVFIEDLHSRNGVLVNGRALPSGPPGRLRLSPGDRIEIADFEFVFEDQMAGTVEFTELDDTRAEILSTVDISGDSSFVVAQEYGANRLQAILGIIEATSNELDLQRVLPSILDGLFRGFPQAENSVLLLRDESTGEFQPIVWRFRSAEQGPIRVSRTFVRHVVEAKTAVLSADALNDSRFDASASAHAMRWHSVMGAPLIGRDRQVFGLIQLDVRGGFAAFTDGDLQVLAGVARHLAIVVENATFHAAALTAQRSELESRFRRLIEGSIQGILIHRDFRPLFVNEAWARLYGSSVVTVMQMETVLALVGTDERERAFTNALTASPDGVAPSRYEIQETRPDGSTRWLEKSVTVVEWEGGPATQTAVIDISDRKRAEESLRSARDELENRVAERTAALAEANRKLECEIEERRNQAEKLRDSEALYHSLVDHIPLCVARKDLRGVFTFVNRALADLFGQAPEWFIGKTDFGLFSHEQAEVYRRDDEEVARTGQLRELFEAVPLPNGEVLQIHTLKTPIYDAERRVIGTQLIFWDVTAQKKTEEERNRYARELERSNRDLEQFAYSVSHDLKSPLRTIATYCQMLQQRCRERLGPEAEEFLNEAIAGTQRMKQLLEDLLAYSRVTTQAKRFAACGSQAALAQAVNNLRAAIEESGAVVANDQLPPVIGDETQLMQLFQNLIDNAIRYRREEPLRVHVGVEDEPEAWRFHVRDNGLGVEERYFDRIFQVFQRLHSGHEIPGSGIGLAICKRIVERHGGKIWVESRPGLGSTFYFTLPKRPNEPT